MKTKHKLLLKIAEHYTKKNKIPLHDTGALKQNEINGIIVLSTTAIGDTLLSTPLFSALRKKYPSSLIGAMIREKYCDFFSSNPDIDHIIPYYNGLIGFYKTLKELKKTNFDVALISHISDPQPVIASAMAGIPYIIGEYPDNKINFLFSLIVKTDPNEHVIENRMAPLKAITFPVKRWPHRMVLPLNPEHTDKVWNILREKHKTSCRKPKFIGFQPGASRHYRMWPKENFIALGKKLLAKDDNFVIFIFGSPAEAPLCEAIQNGIGQQKRAFFLCCSLTDLPHILKKIDCLVTNDTGPMHIAIAVETSTVSLFVPSESHRIGPYQDLEKHRVITKKRPCVDDCIGKKCKKTPTCMNLISPNEVFDAVMDVVTKDHH